MAALVNAADEHPSEDDPGHVRAAGQLLPPLEDNPARPRHLLTEPGMGYRYQP
jgi:hypothetical protein